jgi:hypothetical protein
VFDGERNSLTRVTMTPFRSTGLKVFRAICVLRVYRHGMLSTPPCILIRELPQPWVWTLF